ncbi:hypothetical protein LTR91_008267 [Friedmanniomyces endolithicus]|uniref:Uncharacterized protein n=1 Tax=Friedmanniomyces endolithicus TaxID=329885 RepID=A0A4U0UKD7_9PEZI|nr:hypothetical protein LTS09_001593 [Friedmanniomyces endolithicus]KAK0291760.1 hypothetical protein LTR35_001188 [Friedmanniomyces endolithicus]KAK0296566.1 hypothetical protein LTS00_004891 [Friedmanniomyces endolithicus]KAK0304586.1 hypothetical protein LTR01_007379 [Friedmanniomyces endolithicus]KAK0324718.1 hypothetical protein LTR82_004423 [Friedmanniomyces endolithicus]
MSALTTRDLNTQPANTEKQAAVGEENRPQELQHKHLLGQKSSSDKSGAYISPSDAIMSPASQKLAGFKQRQITKQQSGKNTTSRMLFAKTPSTSSGGPEEDDVEGNQGR